MSAMCCAGMNFAASRCMKEYAAGISSSEISLVDVPATSRDAATVDRFLAKATKEHAAGHVDQPLWVRAVAQAGGDEALTTRLYLDSRATALRVEKRQERAARHARVVEELSSAPDPGIDAQAPEARNET